MVVHSFYPADPRVRRETEALLGEGWSVDVVCLRGDDESSFERNGENTIYRLPIARHRGGGLVVYTLEYLAFFFIATFYVSYLHLRKRFDVVQAHNMPDFLVFTAMLPRLLGARVILDIHDPIPELYMAKFGGNPDHPAVRLVRWLEKRSAAFAHHVITVGEPSRRRIVERSVAPEKLTVVVNSADPRLFPPRDTELIGDSEHFDLIYHGGLFDRYGLDIAIRAVAVLRDTAPTLRLKIYGRGEASHDLQKLILELDLADRVLLGGYVPIEHVARIIADADLGIVPYRRNRFTDLLYATKAFEYIVVGIPTIVTRIEGMVDLFNNVPDMFVEPDQVDDLATRILSLYLDRPRLDRLIAAQRLAYAPYSWESQRRRYVDLMSNLVRRTTSRAPITVR